MTHHETSEWEPSTFQCGLCGYTTEQQWGDVIPASITEHHDDERDGLLCLRSTLEIRT